MLAEQLSASTPPNRASNGSPTLRGGLRKKCNVMTVKVRQPRPQLRVSAKNEAQRQKHNLPASPTQQMSGGRFQKLWPLKLVRYGGTRFQVFLGAHRQVSVFLLVHVNRIT